MPAQRRLEGFGQAAVRVTLGATLLPFSTGGLMSSFGPTRTLPEVVRRLRVARLVAAALIGLVVLIAGSCTSSSDGEEHPPSSTLEGSGLHLVEPRAVHRATVLEDGRVLITGGCTQPGCGGFDEGRRAELYVPGGEIEPGPVMASPRASGTATLLRDGRVLLTGGYPGEGRPPTASAEVYDPRRNASEPVADLVTARADHTATLLPGGAVLLAGGFGRDGVALASTEVFDPATGAFRGGPDLNSPRAAHVATTVGGLGGAAGRHRRVGGAGHDGRAAGRPLVFGTGLAHPTGQARGRHPA
jgi:hypothetical protein